MISQKGIFGKVYGRKTIVAISVFYAIAILLRYLTNKTQLLSGVNNTFLKVILQGIGPTVGALVAYSAFQIKSVMTLKGDFRNFFVPLLIYWLFPIILIELVVYFSKEVSPRSAVVTILVYGLLEEIGWRGFLRQALSSLPKFIRISVVTVLWFIWHLNFDVSISNLTFFVILLLGSWAMDFIAEKTNSLLCVSAFHSLNNFFSDLDLYKSLILSFLLVVWILSIVYRRKLGGEVMKKHMPMTLA